MNELRDVVNAYHRGFCTAEFGIAKISNILDTAAKKAKKAKKAKPDIRRGTVFTTRLGGKCVAMSEPDEDGQFWMYGTSGSKQFQNVSNVMKVHKKESKRMIRVISDMCDSPGAWYNQIIYTGYDE